MLTARQKTILTAAYRDLATLRTAERQDVGRLVGPAAAAVRAHNARIDDAPAGIVEIRAATWLGRALTPSDRASNSYAYAVLQQVGLVELLSAHGDYGQKFRAVAFKFTAEGEALAAELLAHTEPSSPLAVVTLAPATVPMPGALPASS